MNKKRSLNKKLTLLTLLAFGSAMAQPPSQTQTAVKHASPALRASTMVTLNFVNADIEAVSRAMGAMLKRDIMVDPRVKGQITLYSDEPMTVNQAYLKFLSALRGLTFTMVDSAGLLKIVPEADAKLQAAPVAIEQSKQRGDQLITQIFTVNYENANNLVAVLRPLISPNNTINANPGNNTLVITDYADNLQRVAKIIAALDSPGSSDIDVVPLKYAVAVDLAPLVLKLTEGGVSVVPGAPGGTSTVLADPRGNALILRASNPAKLAAMREMVMKLDQPLGKADTNIHVVYLKNADAAKLATVLRAAFASGGNSGGGSGGSSSNSGSSSLRQNSGVSSNSNPTQSSTNGDSSGASTASTSPVAASPSPSTGGFVQADPSTNSLIITAAEPLYRQVRNVIEQLDGRRAQVYVESMIVKIDVSKAAQFGFQWQNIFGNTASSTITGVGTNFGTGLNNIVNSTVTAAGGVTSVGTALSSSSVSTGLNLAVFKKLGSFYTLGALANFLEGQTGANVLSTPTLVALDNEEAKIVVGQNVPFVTGSFTNTGATGSSVNPFQTVDRKDVGLTLRVRSQIGEGGTIRMTLYEENSSITAGTANNTNGPTTDKSSIETSVTVDDGSTIVLGGLMQDEYADADNGVPGLSSIPLLGNLFKSQNRSRIKTELLVFLRPVVLRDQGSADQLTIDRYQAIRALQQTAPSVGKSPLLLETGNPVLPPLPAASTPQPAVKQP